MSKSEIKKVVLANVGGEGNYLAVIFVFQPLQYDRGIETARIGQYYFFYC